MENPLVVFVSSVIAGLEAERQAVRAALQAIPLTRPWVFEFSPASSLPLAESYLSQVRACDIFLLLLGDRVTDPVKAEVETAQAADKPLLVLVGQGAPGEVVSYAQSLGVKYATFASPEQLAAQAAEAAADELITGYRRHQVLRSDLGDVIAWLDRLAAGETHIDLSGDQNVVITAPVQGNVEITYGDVYKTVAEERGDPVALRQAYLHRVLEQTQTLQLTGVDPKATQDATARSGLALAAVYTALMTQQSEQELGRRGQVDPMREAHRLSAVELLDRERKLTLLGDPGSGKSTFVNFVALCLAGEALGRPDCPRRNAASERRNPSPRPGATARCCPCASSCATSPPAACRLWASARAATTSGASSRPNWARPWPTSRRISSALCASRVAWSCSTAWTRCPRPRTAACRSRTP
jgi:hypothetical protein